MSEAEHTIHASYDRKYCAKSIHQSKSPGEGKEKESYYLVCSSLCRKLKRRSMLLEEHRDPASPV